MRATMSLAIPGTFETSAPVQQYEPLPDYSEPPSYSQYPPRAQKITFWDAAGPIVMVRPPQATPSSLIIVDTYGHRSIGRRASDHGLRTVYASPPFVLRHRIR